MTARRRQSIIGNLARAEKLGLHIRAVERPDGSVEYENLTKSSDSTPIPDIKSEWAKRINEIPSRAIRSGG